MSEKKQKLSVQEEIILAIYRLLYDVPYDCKPDLDDKKMNPVHINAQKADFFFSKLMLPVGDYGFSWNNRGPYSALLQSDLHSLDEKQELINNYYRNWDTDKEAKLNDLFTLWQINKAKWAAEAVRDVVKGNNGGELLGSLLFISTTVLPGCEFAQVNQELQRRKEIFPCIEDNLKAWKSLQRLNLVPASE